MSADERVTRSDEPHDRLTGLCNDMTDLLDALVTAEQEKNPDAKNVRAIVFLDDDDAGGIVVHGYDDMTDAMVDLLMHVKAMFNSMGKDVEFVAVPQSAAGL